MSSTLTIELKQLRFFAFHGLYEEEKKTGNEFEVTLFISYKPAVSIITDLSATIDYSVLFDLLKNEMQKPRELLETLSMDIIEKIRQSFPSVWKAEIIIEKLSPPIEGFIGRVGVRYSKEW
ncbi:MAG TPA: dihydroneopterin aldolase [Chitinophagaceae bacterium]